MPIIAGRASAAYGAGFAAVTTAAFAPIGAFDALGTVTVPAGGLSSITFAGIPQTGYSHLQIRATSVASGEMNHYMQFNGDTSANYSWHELYGTGSAATSANSANVEFIKAGYNGTTLPAPSVIDILDYTNTNKFKTTRGLAGSDNNTGSNNYILFRSGNWRSTAAINSIYIYPSSATTFSQNTSFSLYGVK
jgi:hypothetical protein